MRVFLPVLFVEGRFFGSPAPIMVPVEPVFFFAFLVGLRAGFSFAVVARDEEEVVFRREVAACLGRRVRPPDLGGCFSTRRRN